MTRLLCVGQPSTRFIKLGAIPSTPTKVLANAYMEAGGDGSERKRRRRTLGRHRPLLGPCWRRCAGRAHRCLARGGGVQTAVVRRIAGARSPCTAFLVDDRRERLICTYNDPVLNADATWLPIALLVDVVLADVRWPEGAARALAAARAAGVPAVLDGDVAPAATLRELCRCCDYAIFSHPGLSLASGAAAVGEGLRRMQKIAGGMVGVTLGADGFLWLDARHEQRARPPRVVVVDTLAAGDVFMPRSHWRSANDARSPMPLRSSERCPIPRAGYANGLRARAALKR